MRTKYDSGRPGLEAPPPAGRMPALPGVGTFLAVLWFFLSGCASPNQNPASPRLHTGYVDFYTDTDMDLSWQVKWLDEKAGTARTVFSEFEPVPGNILRLAATPGKQRYQIFFINRATEGPQVVEIEVDDGKITPVHIELTPVGTTQVDRQDYAVRGSAKGYGRKRKFYNDTNQIYKISATPQPEQNYRVKEQMPYWSPGNPG
jgi:hypothetical protein